ncbi:DUF1428 domain-containing protein [Jannaschia aquimarina]|uniref:DUF1428 domain-containing protein n=1 Tax=Jannaschia aquimarina TaxID=935700 RepID=A0A0D1CIL0_9RHOB|nr:DUF1428 domain-containing protein [Jannaschia aquimarina]KIT14572.1 hypothetical protein jaqu_38620 [Jannaschia aquimarina]SNT35029.1 Uncharacterized conserved protein YbaA, DUF1428 family [Jannaschia aquimarina]
MSYFMASVAAVPEANKDAFIAHAKEAWEVIFKPLGALSITESWGDDVPDGEVTSFPMAVKRQDGEAVLVSWIEWPDRETYAAANDRMRQPDFAEVMAGMSEMPFDGKRMIWGGFAPVVNERV